MKTPVEVIDIVQQNLDQVEFKKSTTVQVMNILQQLKTQFEAEAKAEAEEKSGAGAKEKERKKGE